MSFIKDVGDKVNSLSKDVATKTKNLAEITRLNSENNHTQRNIEDYYKKIGQMEYELYLKGEANKVFDEDLTRIKGDFDKIAENEVRILELKNIVVCPKCSTKLDIESKFCSNCGTKIERPVDPEEEITE